MKFSEKWLREWVPHRLDVGVLAERLTMAGLEVGALEPAAAPLGGVVVGEILTVVPHPQADRLRICKVDVGGAKPLTIVCGALNAAVGMKVPTALVGAVLPGGGAVKKASIRSVASAGMLCSAAELGLEEASEGLLSLDKKARPGATLTDHLQLNDTIIDLELTPNRGDCLSIGGIAREVSVLTGVRVRPPRMPPVPAGCKDVMKVTLRARRDCSHYAGRVITDIDPVATTPLWMRERLRRGGQRSLGPVVDVTNYVMLELGQPMHAFDREKLAGGIVVRQANQGERLVLLDGDEITLRPGTVLIADRERPVALAGIMGGLDAAMHDGTRHLFLESAYFRPDAIAGRARELGLQTESSYRFERGVDPALQRLALERATALLLEIVGGRAGPVIEARAAAHLPRRVVIRLRHARVGQLLGLELGRGAVERILGRLGMGLTGTADGWRVNPPAHRFDIGRECDLIEEIARVHGYDKIPVRAPRVAAVIRPLPEGRIGLRRFRDRLIDRDYQEVITYSFVAPELETLIDAAVKPAQLTNPLSADLAVMRTSMWPGLLQAVKYNLRRQHRRVRLFEMGAVFLPGKGSVREESRLAGAVVGSAQPEQWGTGSRPVDFFDVKGDVEALLALGGRLEAFQFRPSRAPALHPGQAAEILWKGKRVGRLGALHPAVRSELGLDQPVFLFELRVETLQNGSVPAYRPISRFPAIRRDLAVTVDERIHAGQVLEIVSRAAGETLKKLELFDLYCGKGIDSKRKSLAFSLTLQESSRTLKDGEVDKIINGIVAALQKELGAQLRT